MHFQSVFLAVLSFFSIGTNSDVLKAHNSYRAKHGASALKWSSTLEGAARKWVDRCQFEHSGGTVGPYGENLAAGTGSFDSVKGVQMWYDEVKDYNPNNPKPSHFTQVVWKSSKEVGCAIKTCPNLFEGKFKDAKMLVCEYSPPGNVIGQFPKNVQK